MGYEKEIAEGLRDYQEEHQSNSEPPLTKKKSIRQYVLDTNVLMYDASSVFAFQEHMVVIPFDVLEELDRHKNRNDESGRNAREVIRLFDSIVSSEARLVSDDACEEQSWFVAKLNDRGGLLKIGKYARGYMEKYSRGLDVSLPDNRILAAVCCEDYWHDKEDVYTKILPSGVSYSGRSIFVSKDINARLKALSIGLLAEDYKHTRIDFDELYTGVRYLPESSALSNNTLASFRKSMQTTGLDAKIVSERIAPECPIYPNQFIVLSSKKEAENIVVKGGARFQSIGKYCEYECGLGFYTLDYSTRAPRGVRPRNHEQVMSMELLFEPSIQVVTLVGAAGTGKTLLSLASGLEQVERDKMFDKILVARPIVPMGNDIGYLPGDKDEKLVSWMQPIYDNLEYIMKEEEKKRTKNEHLGKNKGQTRHLPITPQFVQSWVKSSSIIELEAMTYIRGRSLPRTFILIDEAQNLTPHEVKTIVSRVGADSKIVLCGDPYQIDRPFLDASSNGLTYMVERFKGQSCYGHVTLTITERSPVAALAQQLL